MTTKTNQSAARDAGQIKTNVKVPGDESKSVFMLRTTALKAINDSISQMKKQNLLADGSAFFIGEDGGISDDEATAGSPICMNIEMYREGARPLTEKGRLELATEERAHAEIIKIAEMMGFKVSRSGDGSGSFGTVFCYDLEASQ